MYANTWCTRCVPQFNQSRLTSVAIVLHDVRKRVLAELHLTRCKQYFRGAFDNAPLGLALVDSYNRFVRVNQTMCRLLGTDAG